MKQQDVQLQRILSFICSISPFQLTQVDVIPRVDQFNTAIRIGADETVDDVRAKERIDVGRLKFSIPVSVDGPAAEIAHGPLYATQFLDTSNDKKCCLLCWAEAKERVERPINSSISFIVEMCDLN
jgi:hypothetical protein